MMQRPGALVLEDGSIFEGTLRGAPIDSKQVSDRLGYGEVVFNTSMTGYQEILTDPSYFGEIVVMTAPQIGNTGINKEDAESKHPWCAGFVVHELCSQASNWRSTGELEDYLVEHSIPCLSGVDTRALTLRLRTLGVARGVILPLQETHAARRLFETLPGFEGRDMISEVSASESYAWEPPPQSKYRVAAMDFGIKWNLLRSLQLRGCQVEVFPASASADQILALKPDGIFLSNGPGDPSAAPYAVKTVQSLLGRVPLFGVCMGHQILSLAIGAKTYKLKFGHRGGNQPVLVQAQKRVEISSHNHGYSVDADSLPSRAEVSHVNLNDGTVEGIRLPEARAFSVQFHPEACPGPHDSVGLFDEFVNLMKANGNVPKVS